MILLFWSLVLTSRSTNSLNQYVSRQRFLPKQRNAMSLVGVAQIDTHKKCQLFWNRCVISILFNLIFGKIYRTMINNGIHKVPMLFPYAGICEAFELKIPDVLHKGRGRMGCLRGLFKHIETDSNSGCLPITKMSRTLQARHQGHHKIFTFGGEENSCFLKIFQKFSPLRDNNYKVHNTFNTEPLGTNIIPFRGRSKMTSA